MEEKVKINISARHVHLTEEAIELLIGHRLTVRNYLNQVGQFASEETVSIKAGDMIINNVRIIGPARKYNQVEISKSDARKLKINPPVRKSGNLEGAENITIFTDRGSIEGNFAIIADRHVHFSIDDATKYGVVDNQLLQLEIMKEKHGFVDLKAKVSSDGYFEVHLDTDDANAFLIDPNDEGVLRKI